MVKFMTEIMETFLDFVYELLPMSPFTQFIQKLENLPYLSYLNWFIPVREILIIANAWLASIFLWYLYGIILRWIKAVS